MNTTKLKQDAKKIANILTKIDPEFHGDLFVEVSAILNKRSQGFTAQLFSEIANRYGVSK